MSANPLRDYPDRKLFAEVDHISNATFTRPEDLDASNSCDLGRLIARWIKAVVKLYRIPDRSSELSLELPSSGHAAKAENPSISVTFDKKGLLCYSFS